MKKTPVRVKKSKVSTDNARAIIKKYIQNPTLWLAEVATGAMTYDRKEFFLAGGHLVQGAIKWDLWNEFLTQLNNAREKGQTKGNFYESRKGRTNFNELFTYLDKTDASDEEVFKAMKAIFLASTKIDTNDKKEILAYELIQVCKKLRSIDILVLLAAYDFYLKQQKGEFVPINTVQDWQVKISEKIGLPVDLVVQSRIQFSGNDRGDSPFLFAVEESATPIPNIGLNALSIEIGKFITEGNNILNSEDKKE